MRDSDAWSPGLSPNGDDVLVSPYLLIPVYIYTYIHMVDIYIIIYIMITLVTTILKLITMIIVIILIYIDDELLDRT